jgi:hypothetical protein
MGIDASGPISPVISASPLLLWDRAVARLEN